MKVKKINSDIDLINKEDATWWEVTYWGLGCGPYRATEKKIMRKSTLTELVKRDDFRGVYGSLIVDDEEEILCGEEIPEDFKAIHPYSKPEFLYKDEETGDFILRATSKYMFFPAAELIVRRKDKQKAQKDLQKLREKYFY